MSELDANLKALIEANAVAVTALLSKIEAGEKDVTPELAAVSASADSLTAAIADPPAVESPAEPHVEPPASV